MKLKNLTKIFSRDKETARDSATVNHNMVPNSTPVNTALIGASVGNGLALANGVLGVESGKYAANESVVSSSNLSLTIENEDGKIYHLSSGGAIAMTIPALTNGRPLSFEVVVDVTNETINFTATVGGASASVIWLDTPDMAQGAGQYFFAFRYMPSVGLLGNLYWFKAAA